MSNYLRGEIDLANRSPWHHELQLRDKCYIVSSPVGLYLDVELRDLFHHALCDVAQDRVFPLSHRNNFLLAMETSRKANWYWSSGRWIVLVLDMFTFSATGRSVALTSITGLRPSPGLGRCGSTLDFVSATLCQGMFFSCS